MSDSSSSCFDSPPKSIPDIDGHCSDDDDNLFPSAITFHTEPATVAHSATSLGPSTLSPLKLSPMKLPCLEEEKKAIIRLSQLVKPVFQSIDTIHEHQAIDNKVDSYRDEGGIEALSRHVQDGIMEREGDSPECPSPSAIESKVGGDRITIHLPVFPPGVPLFTAPPNLMEDISIEGVSGLPPFLANTMNQGGASSTILRELLVGQRLAILFSSRPCPHEIVVWLLEVSCLHRDDTLRMSAYCCLCQLLRSSSVAIFPPDIFKAVTYLGGLGSADDHYIHTSRDQFLVSQGVSRILQFLLHCMRKHSYTTEQIKELFGLVLRLALDPLVCQCTVCVGTPMGSVLAALEGSVTSEEDWEDVKTHILGLVASLTTHHHNRLYIIELFTNSSHRLQQLQCELIKQALHLIMGGAVGVATHTGDEENMEVEIPQQLAPSQVFNSTTSDTELVKNILLHYFKINNDKIDYYEAHSAIKLLGMFLHRPDFQWMDKDSRQDFVRLLSDFNTRKMRDNVMELKRGSVKDLVIRLKLELQEEREGLRQTDLFSYFHN